MKNKSLNSSWLVSAAAASILLANTAFGAELIVRYREPQNTISQSASLMWNSLGKENVSELALVSNSEKLVKLHFATQEAADAARAQLIKSGSVLSVSNNHYYRPALHLQAKTTYRVDAAAERILGTSVTALMQDLADAGSLPEVQLPPSDVTVGPDPLAAKDWALQSIRLPRAEDINIDSSHAPVIAAVIDTGVDYNHEDLVGAMWRNPANPQEVGYDFAHHTAKPYDVRNFDLQGCMADPTCSSGTDMSKFLTNPGHGTHCAGHVGAVANNSLGIRGIGSAANVQVMALKFFYDAGEANAGQGDDAAAIESIDYAIQHGVKVISASWGGRMPRADGESSELKQALVRAQQAGVIMVIAAGNDGIDQDRDETPSYPAAYDLDNLIIVAASDRNDQAADFSNYGAKSVHIAAPGVKILSTTVGSTYDDVVGRFKDPQGQQRELDWDGTSMATPIVAGAVALVWSAHPSENYHQIRSRILNGARKVPGLAGKVSTGGVLNVSAALAN